MIHIELSNRSGVRVDETAVMITCREVLEAEGIESGELGVAFVRAAEIRELKREYVGVDEKTDVLSFPIDGRDELPAGPPRQLGDVVLCAEVVGAEWKHPLVHGLLHLLGHDHGTEMRRREELHV